MRTPCWFFLLFAMLFAGPAMAVDPVQPGTVQTSAGTIDMPSNAELGRMVGLSDEDAQRLTPSESDKSIQMLIKIFGKQAFGVSEEEESLVGSMIEIWNVSVMILGVIFMAYIIIAGLLKTAHEGEFLGRQWSSIWIPIRSATSYAMILPINNYCLAQIMVIWLATVSIGMAGWMWDGVSGKLMGDPSNGNQMGFVIKPDHHAAKDRVYEAWYSLVCMESVQRMYPDSKMGIINYENAVYGSLGKGFTYGDSSDQFGTDMCGGFSWNMMDSLSTATHIAGFGTEDHEAGQSRDTSITGGIADAAGEVWGGVRDTVDTGGSMMTGQFWSGVWGSVAGRDEDQAKFAEVTDQGATDHVLNEQRKALEAASVQLQPCAKEFVESGGSMSGAVCSGLGKDPLGVAIEDYNKTMDASVQYAGTYLYGSVAKRLRETMQRDGWVYAGAYFMKITHLNEKLRAIAHAEPGSIAVDFDGFDGDDDGQFKSLIKAAETYVMEREKRSGLGVASAYDNETSGWLSNPFYALNAKFVQGIAEPDKHPIVSLQNLGNNIIDWAEVGGVAMLLNGGRIGAAVGGAKSTLIKNSTAKSTDMLSRAEILDKTGKSGDGLRASAAREQRKVGMVNAAEGAGDMLTATLKTMLQALFVGAMILAVVIPLLPFIIWSLDVLGWLIAITVAVIAAPVWMVMHMHPEGHDFAGHGAQGYSLLLSVAMKAPLMIMSLIFAMLLSWVSCVFIGGAWMYATASANSGQLFGPLMSIGNLVLFSVVMLAVVYKSFALIHGIQNEVLSWIGGRDHDLGGAQGQVTAIGAAVTGIATRGTSAISEAGAMGRSRKQMEQSGRAAESERSRDQAAQSTQEGMLQTMQSMNRGIQNLGGGRGGSGGGSSVHKAAEATAGSSSNKD